MTSNPRVLKVLRDLGQHRGRTLLVVVAIAIGIVGAGAVLNTWSLLRRVTREGYLATNPASATLRTDSIDAALLEQVAALPSLRAVQARRTVIGRVLVQGAWRTTMLFAMDDFRTVRIGTLQTEAGSWPPEAGTVVVERSSVDFAGVVIGEALTFRIGDGPEQSLPVVGIARDAGLAPGWMEHTVYVFVTPATLARLGAPASLNQLQILVRDGALDRETVRGIAYQVKQLVERSGRTVSDVEVPEPGRHIHAGQINSLLYTQGGFGVLALFLSAFLVVNLVSAMLAGQLREIGVMKAIGAQPGQIGVMYLGVALALGLVACLIAIPLALLLGRWYAEFVASLLNFDTSGFGIPRWSIWLQLGVGALLPVAAAAIPVLRGSRITVSAALRDFGIERENGHGGVIGWLLSRVGGVTRPLLLSVRNAFRRRQRMALTMLTLSMGGAVYIGALNLRTSIRNSVGYFYGELLRYDMSVNLSRATSIDSLETAVRSVAGVARAEAWMGRRAAVKHAEGILGDAFPVVALPAGSRMVGFDVEEGRWLRTGGEDENALVVNRRLLEDEPGLSVGSEVALIMGGRRTRWHVVGITGTGPGGMAFAQRDAVGRASGDFRVGQAVVVAEGRGIATQADLSRRLREELTLRGFEVGSSQLMAESRRILEDHLVLVAGFLLIMAQAMIVVGGLGLASTMSLAVLERTREIGVLRAIGARHGAILTLFQVEALVVGLASWAVAIPLSLPMSLFLGRAFGQIMMPVRTLTLIPEPLALLWWLLVVVVVSLAASAWPALRATRVPTAAALAYE